MLQKNNHYLKYLSYTLIGLFFITCNSGGVKYKISKDFQQIAAGQYIRCVESDMEGNLWFGADCHLYKLGDELIEYNSENSGIPDSIFILDIEADNIGNLWIGSNYGLLKYTDGNFTFLNRQDSTEPKNVYNIEVDSQNNVWYCGRNGLTKMSNNNEVNFKPENFNVVYFYSQAMTIDEDDNLLTVVGKNLFKFDGNVWQKFENLDIYNCQNVAIDKTKNVWLTCDYSISSIVYTDSLPKLLVFDSNGDWRKVNPKIFQNDTFCPYYIMSDTKGFIWLPGYNYLSYYDGKSWDKIKFEPAIFDMCEDEKNNLWLGTSDGIYYLEIER